MARISSGEADNALLDIFKCAGQASWTFNDWWKVRGGHCHRGVSAGRRLSWILAMVCIFLFFIFFCNFCNTLVLKERDEKDQSKILW